MSADLRAPSTEWKRALDRATKYWSFRAVKPGDLTSAGADRARKRCLYQEAQGYPRPPTYHHSHVDKLRKDGARPAYDGRRYRLRQLRRYQYAVNNSDEVWRGDTECKRCEGDCWICVAEEEYRDALEESYETSARTLEDEIFGELTWEGDCLVDIAVAKQEERMWRRAEKEGWEFISTVTDDSADESEYDFMED